MVLRFLSKSPVFKGVGYNTDKVNKNLGELVCVRNFGILEGIENLRPQDYINYLMAVSSTNRRIKKPQLHAMISAKGRSHTKEELESVAHSWLDRMGYGKNPYLLIFHKDTKNNHIHMVSTRVGRDGKKIEDSMEGLIGYKVLCEILGRRTKRETEMKIQDALSYNFSTVKQLQLVLEKMGFDTSLKDNGLQVIELGSTVSIITMEQIQKKISAYEKDKKRIAQIRAILGKYQSGFDPSIYPERQNLSGGRKGPKIGYTSELLDFVKKKFGLEAVFHFSGEKMPYGYTLIDHAKKQVFSGGDVQSLQKYQFIDREDEIAPSIADQDDVTERTLDYLESKEVEEASNIPLTNDSNGPLNKTPADAHPGNKKNENSKSATSDRSGFQEDGKNSTVNNPVSIKQSSSTNDRDVSATANILPEFEIMDDIDDEAILGRNRQRKRKARTNTR